MLSYISDVLTAIDQLGNTVAGGNPDVTVSGRIGYQRITTNKWYWIHLEHIIDYTFKPIDGEFHCNKTYLSDNDVDLTNGSTISLFVLAIFAVSTCIILIPIIKILALFLK
jgi:hypothetical protein